MLYNLDVKPDPEELLKNVGCTYGHATPSPTPVATAVPAAATPAPKPALPEGQYAPFQSEKIESYPTR